MSAEQHAVSIPVIDMWAPIVPSVEIIADLRVGFPTEKLQYLEVFTKTTVSARGVCRLCAGTSAK